MRETGVGPFNAGLRQRNRNGNGGNIAVGPQQDFPYLSDQERLNPQAFARGYGGNGNTLINDERAIGARAAQLAGGVADINDVLASLDAHNKPPQLKQVPFLVFIKAAATPYLLIPYNPKRLGIIVSNYRVVPESGATGVNGVCFSFGEPMQSAAGELVGIPLSPCYQETNGTISVDAIYVFCNDDTQTFPIPVLGYEANLALGGSNPR